MNFVINEIKLLKLEGSY